MSAEQPPPPRRADRQVIISRAGTACASAAAVWELLGPGFAQVSRWSSLNLASQPLPCDKRSVEGAPAGRAVETPLGRFEERIVEYDPVQRTLAFTVEGDLAKVGLETAADAWSVTETSTQSCRIQVDCTVAIHPGSPSSPAELRERIGGILELMIRELAYFAIHGRAP